MTKPAALTMGDPAASGFWIDDATHRAALMQNAKAQVAFFARSLRGDGRIDMLDWSGAPIPDAPQELFITTRLVHSFALAKLAGIDGCDAMIDGAMAQLWDGHRDAEYGGYVWALTGGAVSNDGKTAYGHVFVLLAAASAKLVGHPDADRLLADITEVIETRFWDAQRGLLVDEYSRDWSQLAPYRGMNANMHGVEAMLAAYEATGEAKWLTRAGRILEFFIGQMAPANGWRIPEHYTEDWQVDQAFVGNPMFKPEGSTPGHSFEMARLLLQYWDLSGRKDADTPDAVRKLAQQAHRGALWPEGGYAYTLTLQGAVDIRDRYWWPVTEAIGVYAALIKLGGTAGDEAIYRQLWQFSAEHFIDADGAWFPEIDADGAPTSTIFTGKPDIYHSLQAALFPLAPGLSRLYGRAAG